MARYALPFSKSVKSTVMTTEVFDMFKILTLKEETFSQTDAVLIRHFSKKLQSDPLLIRKKLASVLIRAHVC